MLVATQGLVLHTTPYSETSVIVKVFTERLGVRSYILKGVRKTGSRLKQGLLKPLSWIDMVVYDNPHTSINYIKEISAAAPPTENNESVNAVIFFMDELLYRTLRESEPMPELFRYVTSQLQILATEPARTSAIPIIYLITVARLLGIAPLDNYSLREPYFCLSEGRYVSAGHTTADPTTDLIDEHHSAALHNYLSASNNDSPIPIYPASTRMTVIYTLIDYYKHHLAYFGNFKSHEILHGVLA